MDKDQINQQIDEIDRDLIRRKDTLNLVEVERHALNKRLVELGEAVRMEKHNISRRVIERRILERAYWKAVGK